MLDLSEDLPPLPRRLKKTEANKSTRIGEWLKKNYPRPYVYEVKVDNNKLEPHQKKFLKKYMNGTFEFKMSDATVGKLPFDGFGSGLSGGDALVITYYTKTKTCDMLVLNTGKTITFKP